MCLAKLVFGEVKIMAPTRAIGNFILLSIFSREEEFNVNFLKATVTGCRRRNDKTSLQFFSEATCYTEVINLSQNRDEAERCLNLNFAPFSNYTDKSGYFLHACQWIYQF